MLNIDLHCHSTASDGVLSPEKLLVHAASLGVNVLALTDHDAVSGLDEARKTADREGITFINGIELSVTWRNRTLHILGLDINPDYQPLLEGLHDVCERRTERAQKIAAELGKHGISGSYEGACSYAGEGRLIGRTHFARFLVAHGYAKDVKTVFKKFLVKGKPGYTPHEWASLSQAIDWIRSSGGRAVIAHPARYQLGKNLLDQLLDEFKVLGGAGIEVVSSSHTSEQVKQFAQLAIKKGLFASCGSDYHGPNESYFNLGKLPQIPAECIPIWHDWVLPAS
ncbi:MAG: 3',5'-nucleoside bisphosphate phosphatase [Nitrosomonas sp.]|jgi:predicted metal-dependent phosphoesterase TrpH|nr:PHP domain-containing protein [Nitrosomonas sp.]MCC7136016.1 PHP domain-containing protein [Nitrosomonas sp.]